MNYIIRIPGLFEQDRPSFVLFRHWSFVGYHSWRNYLFGRMETFNCRTTDVGSYSREDSYPQDATRSTDIAIFTHVSRRITCPCRIFFFVVLGKSIVLMRVHVISHTDHPMCQKYFSMEVLQYHQT